MTYKIYKSFCVNKIKDNTKRFVKISQIVLPFIRKHPIAVRIHIQPVKRTKGQKDTIVLQKTQTTQVKPIGSVKNSEKSHRYSIANCTEICPI